MTRLLALLNFRFYICIIFVIFASKSKTTMTTSSSVTLKLIHPNLIRKPYDNSNVTLLEHVNGETYSSMARYKYLKMRSIQTLKNDDIQSTMMPGMLGACFYINLSIGEPPVPQTVQIDSGSNLLWVPCHPWAERSSEFNPVYDPSKSHTYSSVPCYSLYCSNFDNCSNTQPCTYNIKYADNSSTKGELGMEEFKFSTVDDGKRSISNVVFGCGHGNLGVGFENGIIGLGADPLSLVSQLGTKFSYCLGNLDDLEYEYNHLVIGKGAYMEGYSTPMRTYGGMYYLTLEGISIGDKGLDINPRIFIKRSSWGTNGVIIDSGTTFTYLARSAYYPLSEEVESLIAGNLRKVTFFNSEKLCYMGKVSQDLKGFPIVTFQFAAGADLVVDEEGMFVQLTPDIFCLGVVPVPDSELNVIGLMAQQYYNIGYDTEEMMLFFQRIDCELLVD